MITSLVSTSAIIAKLYRDLRIQDTSYEADAIEWIGEAIGLIGNGVQFERKSAVLTIASHSARMPKGMFQFQEAYLLDKATGPLDLKARRLPMVNTSSVLIPLLDRAKKGLDDSFVLQGGYIHTGLETCYVLVVYDGIAVDEEGMPLVPDEPDFQNALIWYIMRQMILGGWNHPSTEIGFERANHYWEKYCGQARTTQQIPTIAQYEEFKNNWVTLLPADNRREDGFAGPDQANNFIYGNTQYLNR